jgi:hypothetical protein
MLCINIFTFCIFFRIVQRHQGRFEIPYQMTNICNILDSIEFSRFNSLLHGIFNGYYTIINQSLVMSHSGTEQQKWHQDGPHLSQEEHLPCHCMNMYVQLLL